MVMLETTIVHVAPVALCYGCVGNEATSSNGNGYSNGYSERVNLWVIRVAVALLASSSFAAAVEERDGHGRATGYDVSQLLSSSGGGESAEASEYLGDTASDTLATPSSLGIDTSAATVSSLLESLLASMDAFLKDFGLPCTSVVCATLAVAILAFALIRKIGIGGGGNGRGGGGSAKKRKGVVLFLGPCGSGKTAMCQRLCHDRLTTTVTSMQACRYDSSRLTGGGRGGGSGSSCMVDYPGHERLRGGISDELQKADRVVFVLDGSCLASQVAAGAELLYDVLTNPAVEGCRGLMVALNKSDVKEAKPSRAKLLLQKELEKLRATRGTLGTQGEEDDMPLAIALGRPGHPFALDVDSPCEVTIAACSVVKGGALDPVVDFVKNSVL